MKRLEGKVAVVTGSNRGIAEWFLIAAATGYIFSFIYNWMAEKLQ